MPLNKFGELLRAKGFVMKKNNGRKGYLVVCLRTEIESTDIAKTLLNEKDVY